MFTHASELPVALAECISTTAGTNFEVSSQLHNKVVNVMFKRATIVTINATLTPLATLPATG